MQTVPGNDDASGFAFSVPFGSRTPDADFPSIATLVAVTPDAKRSLGLKSAMPIRNLPFKVGRESRSGTAIVPPHIVELRLGIAPQLNDVYLLEPPWKQVLHVSREHFLIEEVDGQFFVVDRGSVCGTIVAGKPVGGGRAGGRIEVHDGDLIVIGTAASPYIFRFEITRPT